MAALDNRSKECFPVDSLPFSPELLLLWYLLPIHYRRAFEVALPSNAEGESLDVVCSNREPIHTPLPSDVCSWVRLEVRLSLSEGTIWRFSEKRVENTTCTLLPS